MVITLEREYLPREKKTFDEKSTTHYLFLSCKVGNRLIGINAEYTYFDDFHQLYFDMLRSLSTCIQNYSYEKIGKVDERRSRKRREMTIQDVINAAKKLRDDR